MEKRFNEQGGHVFNWRKQWTLDNPVRRWLHPPAKLLGGFVRPGMTVVDAGCGTGLFSLAMAEMVGPEGRVFAVDLQPEALARVAAKAERAGLHPIIEPRQCGADDIGELPACDFALAFYMAHEVPDIDVFFNRMHQCLRPGSTLLLIEPRFHIRRAFFAGELTAAQKAGFSVTPAPSILGSHAAALRKD
ncbi:MAG: methyltransferase domain-containing protein [Pseudodesulfovibrio sp.]